ncbi:MAG: hypothetical protein K6L74_00945 [Neptuniibacter sp.]
MDELDFEKWEALIGKIILACTKVEYELTRLYEVCLPNRDFHKDDYSGRFDKAIGVAKSRLKNGDVIANMLIEMKKYSKIRHMVAHNPIHYLSQEERKMVSDGCEFGILDAKKGGEVVTIKSIEKDATNASNLSNALCSELRINVA